MKAIPAIRTEVRAIRKAIAVIEFQLGQLESQSRTPRAPSPHGSPPVKRPPGVEMRAPFKLKMRRSNR